MSKNSKAEAEVLIPFQVKARPEVRKRIVEVAKKRGLSANDVASLALAAGVDRVIAGLDKMTAPELTEVA